MCWGKRKFETISDLEVPADGVESCSAENDEQVLDGVITSVISRWYQNKGRGASAARNDENTSTASTKMEY